MSVFDFFFYSPLLLRFLGHVLTISFLFTFHPAYSRPQLGELLLVSELATGYPLHLEDSQYDVLSMNVVCQGGLETIIVLSEHKTGY